MRYFTLLLITIISNLTLAQVIVPPTWITGLTEFKDRKVNQWAEYETTVLYRDIVKLQGLSTFFGINGNASKGGVVVFMTLNMIRDNANNGSTVNNNDALLYGAYSDSNSSFNNGKSWLSPVSDYSILWGDTELNLTSTEYRKRTHHTVDYFFEDDPITPTVIYDAWRSFYGTKLGVKVTVITFGTSKISDCKYALPGIYKDAINLGYLTSEHFKTLYNNNDIFTWINNDKIATDESVMVLNTSDDLQIRGNQPQQTNGDLDTKDIKLEVWGKMLSYNAIKKPTPPSINPEYSYGLWVAGEMVSENFYMHPRATWADYVFDNDYKLPDLTTVATFIKQNNHLLGIPCAKEISKGYSQHEMNKSFLEKIEELSLYKIKQHQLVQEYHSKLQEQQKRIDALKEKFYKN